MCSTVQPTKTRSGDDNTTACSFLNRSSQKKSSHKSWFSERRAPQLDRQNKHCWQMPKKYEYDGWSVCRADHGHNVDRFSAPCGCNLCHYFQAFVKKMVLTSRQERRAARIGFSVYMLGAGRTGLAVTPGNIKSRRTQFRRGYCKTAKRGALGEAAGKLKPRRVRKRTSSKAHSNIWFLRLRKHVAFPLQKWVG
jgi:hypothetical protein